MFQFLKKDTQADNKIYAPVNGMCLDIACVPDQMFSSRMLGDGVAFTYDGNTLYSPIQGTIKVVTPTKHAIGIKTKSGMELLLHIGVNTVELDGAGFDTLVSVNQTVKVGTPLIQIDREFMKQNQIDLITSMVITNSDNFICDFHCVNQEVNQGKSEIAIYCERK